MTTALLDRPTTAPGEAADTGRRLVEATSPSPAARRPRRPRPHLLPVPDCEPPLQFPQEDELLLAQPQNSRELAALFAGDGVAAAPRLAPPRPEPGPVTAPPAMTHRRWPVDTGFRRATSAESGADLPHRVHSAAGAVAADDDAAWPAVALPPELSRRPRPAAFATAAMLARATIETLTGFRPIVQLQPYYSAGVFGGLQEFPMLGHRRDTQLVSLWVCEPTPDSAEVSASFRCGSRTRAMAMQLRARRDRWFVTSLQIG